jgi:hypothetical protein
MWHPQRNLREWIARAGLLVDFGFAKRCIAAKIGFASAFPASA